MPKGKIGAALVCFFVIATTAGTWAAYSYAVPSIPLLLSSAAYERASINCKPPTRMPRATGSPLRRGRSLRHRHRRTGPAPAAFALASVNTTAVEPPKLASSRASSRASLPPPRPKSRNARWSSRSSCSTTHRSPALRTRLKLSPTQEEFWPAVEVTLRNVVRQHARKTRKDNPRGAPQIDVNSAEVQQLISAAVPLIMRLSEEQKREVRQLARIIGLETVASRI